MSDDLDELDMAMAHVRSAGTWQSASDVCKAIECIVRHLRASQPQPATGEAGREGPSDEIEWCQCGKPAVWPDHHNPEGEDVPLELCDACRKLQDDAFEAGLSHARSEAEAEAMREVCDVARQYVSVVRLHGREVEPGSTEARLFEVVDALSGTGWPLRPGEGTP